MVSHRWYLFLNCCKFRVYEQRLIYMNYLQFALFIIVPLAGSYKVELFLKRLTTPMSNRYHDSCRPQLVRQLLYNWSAFCGVLVFLFTLLSMIFALKTKRRRSDPVLWQKPLHQQKCQKGKTTTQTTSQKSSIKQQLRELKFHNIWIKTSFFSS